MEIARLSRCKGQEQKKQMQEKYRELVRLARQVRNQAQRFSEEIHSGVKRAANQKQQAVLRGMKRELDAMIPLVNQVLRQTTARVFRGVTDTPGKIVSVFEPTAEIIPQGQSEQADRVRQAGEDTGSRESDYYPLWGVPAAAGRLDLAAGSGAPASATAGASARAVGWGCWFLLGGK